MCDEMRRTLNCRVLIAIEMLHLLQQSLRDLEGDKRQVHLVHSSVR